ncbi:MAG TPA: hypothetical protein G4O17_05190 [Dehalococcoidia bacterium]|nr:hypothetical protein [Dehalococcoidia bacterium]
MESASGEPRIEGDELQKCLDYLQEELKLAAFQDKEATLYKNASAKYIDAPLTDNLAPKERCRAANRLAQAAGEIVNRRYRIEPIPDAASAAYSAWQLAYLDYSAWVSALSAAIEAIASDIEPPARQVLKLASQFQKSRNIARTEGNKFIDRLGLNGNTVQKLLNEAAVAVAADNWQPKEVNQD